MNRYYEILGLKPDASELEIKKAYFKLIRQHPPESDPEQFQKIREAYEQLKNAHNQPEGPSFPPFSDPAAEKMYQRIIECRHSGNKKMLRDCCEEACRLFPDDAHFLYLLISAQRECGNTGKAVKSSELLVSKDPDNKWYQKELAISYMERGFTNKAFPACQKAYELGCRDLDFLLFYAHECDHFMEYDMGKEILLNVIRQEKKWSREEIPELVETYIALLHLNLNSMETHFLEIATSLKMTLEKYSLYLSEYFFDLCLAFASTASRGQINKEEHQCAEEVFALIQKLSSTDEEATFFDNIYMVYQYYRLTHDVRIGDILPYYLEVMIDASKETLMSEDSMLQKFRTLDLQLCMLEDRQNILEQAEIIKDEYPAIYEKIKDFILKLESEKNIQFLKESLQKKYHRVEPFFDDGLYYKLYPQEKIKAQNNPINMDNLYEPYKRDTKKVGRNDPCPCGSGKKYKQCCMNKNKTF